LDNKGHYRSKDLETLTQRIVNTVQAYTRSGVNALDLEGALSKVKDLSGAVLDNVRQETDLQALGVFIENLHFTAVNATPEMRKALEVDYREHLQKRADQAIYDHDVPLPCRRNASSSNGSWIPKWNWKTGARIWWTGRRKTI